MHLTLLATYLAVLLTLGAPPTESCFTDLCIGEPEVAIPGTRALDSVLADLDPTDPTSP